MHASIFGVEDLARPSPMGRIEALDMLVLYWRELHDQDKRPLFAYVPIERALEIGIRQGNQSPELMGPMPAASCSDKMRAPYLLRWILS
jgi:hypothetical protein